MCSYIYVFLKEKAYCLNIIQGKHAILTKLKVVDDTWHIESFTFFLLKIMISAIEDCLVQDSLVKMLMMNSNIHSKV